MSDDKNYILNNVLSGLIPYCFFNGTVFNYNKGFKDNINVNFFENYFKYNFSQIKKINTPFVYLYVFSNKGVLKIANLYCKNHFDIDRYKKTSIVMYINTYEFNVIKSFLPNYDVKKFDSKLIDFNSRGWVVLWLFSTGFTRKQISEFLKISYENVSKRLFRIKNKFKASSLEELKFFVRDSGLIYTHIPSQFNTNKILRII
ncbi:helix-turn-helix transcriptional regulator [Gilliamella sp. BG7]|uniref:helix-turn-helix transcriptional regulator n=1 Tax=unclassified Gilliamella TaxID=2685620 RepID=UPI00398574BB